MSMKFQFNNSYSSEYIQSKSEGIRRMKLTSKIKFRWLHDMFTEVEILS